MSEKDAVWPSVAAAWALHAAIVSPEPITKTLGSLVAVAGVSAAAIAILQRDTQKPTRQRTVRHTARADNVNPK